MPQPRLSICIATYNRAGFIGQTLESIIPQLTDDVEIVIVDGASTDNTSEVVNKYAATCPQINYVRLPAKGGVDQDFCKAVEYAKGQYCWLFSDDDLLAPGAVSTVLNELGKGYSLIIVNAQVMNRDFSKVLEPKRLRINANLQFASSEMDQFFERAITFMSFIGCVVIDRQLWMSREKARYFGTEFIHLGVIFQEPLPCPVLIIAQPYIMIRCDNAQWAGRALEIWMFKWPRLLNSFTQISEHVRQKFLKTKLWPKLKDVITFRGLGAYSLKEYHKWFANDPSIGLRFVMYTVAITPACLANVLVLTYFRMFKRRAQMDIYYLANNPNNIMNMFKKALKRN